MPHFLNIQMKGLHYVVKFSMWVKQCHKPSPKSPFFPRASERRVLLKVGVCYTSSHRHIFTSWMVIFTSSHLHIFTSSHLHIFTSSHLLSLSLLPSCPLSGSLCFFFLFPLKAAGGADEAPRYGHAFARNEVRVSKTEWFLCVWLVRRQPFRTKWGSSVKNCGKITILHPRRQPFRTKWG